ncbi:MAG: hypothetical protein ABJG68_05180 [Crocinitomicaceae bacterium]
MKLLFLSLIVCLSNNAFSQVYGEIFMDKREVAKDISYTIEYSKEATLVFDIRVNTDGKVTSCVLNKEKSTTSAYPAMMKAKNKIMNELVFKKGIGYPEFHAGYVQIKTVKPDSTQQSNPYAPPLD